MQRFLFLISIFLVSSLCHSKTLKMAHIVYRHGARSSIFSYPNDIYQFKDWPDGSGRLTQKGMNMEYNLGKFLKKRYIEDKMFLNRTYLHRDIHIRSSDKERCIQSAETQLAGMYPPKGYQVWNKDILWQPIPVHTVERKEDTALRHVFGVPCPRYEQMMNEYFKRPEFVKKHMQAKELFRKLRNYSGMDITPQNMYKICDPTICEITEGWPIPTPLKKLLPEMLEFYYWLWGYRFTGDDELGRLTGGTLLGMINKNMKKFSPDESFQGLRKMNMFSGHDETLLALSTALDVKLEYPYYSACIMVELYEDDGRHFVEMYYRNTQTDEVTALRLKKCQHSCPLSKFLRLTKPRTIEDRSKICSVKDGSWITLFHLEVLVIGLLGLVLMLLLLLVYRVSNKSVTGNKYGWYKTLKDLSTDAANEHPII